MTTKEIEERPNLGSYTNLGTNALYLIEEEELPNFETLRNLETSEHRDNKKSTIDCPFVGAFVLEKVYNIDKNRSREISGTTHPWGI